MREVKKNAAEGQHQKAGVMSVHDSEPVETRRLSPSWPPGRPPPWSPGALAPWYPVLFSFFFNLSFALFHYLFYIFTLSFAYASFG